MPTATTSTLTTQARTFYVGTLLKRALPYLPLLRDGQKTTIPPNSGKTVDWRLYGALAEATTPLTEGVTPAGSTLTQTNTTATIAQYGDYLTVSDLLEHTGIDPNITNASEVLGEQAGQTVHAVTVTALGAGTTVRYAAGTTRVGLTASNVLTVALIRLAVRDLENANVPKFPDGTYHGAISASQKYDLTSDPAYQNLHIYTNTSKLQMNELIPIYGARLVTTTKAPVFAGAGAAGVDVHAALLWGRDAFGVVDLKQQALNEVNAETNRGIDVIVTPLNTPSKSDPLRQRAYVGWKVAFAVKVLYQSRLVRIETGVTG